MKWSHVLIHSRSSSTLQNLNTEEARYSSTSPPTSSAIADSPANMKTAGISDTALHAQHWGLEATSENLRSALLAHGFNAQVETFRNGSKLIFESPAEASRALTALSRIPIYINGVRRRMRVSRWRVSQPDTRRNWRRTENQNVPRKSNLLFCVLSSRNMLTDPLEPKNDEIVGGFYSPRKNNTTPASPPTVTATDFPPLPAQLQLRQEEVPAAQVPQSQESRQDVPPTKVAQPHIPSNAPYQWGPFDSEADWFEHMDKHNRREFLKACRCSSCHPEQ